MAKWLTSCICCIAAVLVAASCGPISPQQPPAAKHGPVVLPDPVEVYTYDGCLCAMELRGAQVKALQELFDECRWQETTIENTLDARGQSQDEIGLSWHDRVFYNSLYVYKNDSKPGLFFDSYKHVGHVGRKGLIAPPQVAQKFREIVVEARKEWEALTQRPIDPPQIARDAKLIDANDSTVNLALSPSCIAELQTILSKGKWQTYVVEHMRPKAEWLVTWGTERGKFMLCIENGWLDVVTPDYECHPLSPEFAEQCRKLLADFAAKNKPSEG